MQSPCLLAHGRQQETRGFTQSRLRFHDHGVRFTCELCALLQADATMHASLVHKMLLIALDKAQDKQRIVADLLSSLIIRDALLVPML